MLLSYYYSCAADNTHKHCVVFSQRFVGYPYANHCVCTLFAGLLLYFSKGILACLKKNLLISAASASEKISQATKNVLEHIGSEYHFACNYSPIFLYRMSFDTWCGCYCHGAVLFFICNFGAKLQTFLRFNKTCNDILSVTRHKHNALGILS